jgi:hypothetical protein
MRTMEKGTSKRVSRYHKTDVIYSMKNYRTLLRDHV